VQNVYFLSVKTVGVRNQ